MKRTIVYCIILAFALVTIGCAPKYTLNKSQYDTIKKVAVIGYTVPSKIKFRDDPQKADGKLTLGSVAKAALNMLSGDGTKASTLAHENFIKTLNSQGLSFVAISQEDLMANTDFTALYVPPKDPMADNDGSLTSKLGSFMKSQMSADPGKSPNMLTNYGLAQGWDTNFALSGKAEEIEYVKKAIKALNVDAVILVNDPGFSFSCEFCIGGTGAASTGSAFIVAMVDRNGETIMAIKEWFATTDEQAALVAGVVNPMEEKALFIEHGNKTAIVFANFLKNALAEGK